MMSARDHRVGDAQLVQSETFLISAFLRRDVAAVSSSALLCPRAARRRHSEQRAKRSRRFTFGASLARADIVSVTLLSLFVT